MFRPRPSTLRTRLAVEALEGRDVPSTLNWVNRGQASDRFADVFGTQAETARKVVDQVLSVWSQVLVNLNQPGSGNSMDFTVQMDAPGTTGFSSSAQATAWNGGSPTAGLITVGRGSDGKGAGWFVDPTPGDSVEFTTRINAFAATAVQGSPAFGLVDFYNFVNSEIVHALGLFSAPAQLQTPANGTITPLNQTDPEYNVGKLFIFDGPSITLLLTTNNGGPAPNGQDIGEPIHTSGPQGPPQPVAFNSQFRGQVLLSGGVDCGNATDAPNSPRELVPDNLALLFKDAYGMTVKLPSSLPNGTFQAQLNKTTGQLIVRGGNGTSADQVRIVRNGSNINVTDDISAPEPVPSGLDYSGTGDPPAETTSFPFASVTSVKVMTGDGPDGVTVDLSGGDPIPLGGFTTDEGAGSDSLNFVGDGLFTVNANSVTITGQGTVQLVGNEQITLNGGPLADVFTVRGFGGTVVIDGGPGNDTYNVNLKGSGNGVVAINDPAGVDTLVVTGTAAADVIHMDDTGLVLGTGETIGFNGSQLESLTVNGGLGDDVITASGFLPTTRLLVTGGMGNDAIDLTGFVGKATLDGGFGDDSLVGGDGNDVLLGGFGNDMLDGGAGRDWIDGGFGDDSLTGGAGIDTMMGGAGNDLLDGQDGEIDFIDGGLGLNYAIVDRTLDRLTRAWLAS